MKQDKTASFSAQLPLHGFTTIPEVVNIASVPQRSIFRYPGGKTWLVPRIRKWLASLSTKPTTFIEPFCGGGIIGLTVAFENLAETVILVERDEQVAAVWKTILGNKAEWLAERIVNFPFNHENVEAEFQQIPTTTQELAFQTILKNRVNRGGILAVGAGQIKNGENGKGLASRWYPETLSKRIRDIATIRDRFIFYEGDGLHILGENISSKNTVFFIDPPYTIGGKKAGSRLYTYSDIDHEILFSITKKLAGEFLMTYDKTQEVATLATQNGFTTCVISMKNTHHAEMNELLIGRNLDWLSQ